MEYLRDLWAGYILGFSSGVARPAVLIVDFLLVSIAIYFFLRLFNSKVGWRFLAGLFLAVVLLIGSSYLALQGLHLVTQGLIIIGLVAIPILFRAELASLLTGEPSASVPTTTPVWLGTLAALGAAVIVLAGNGSATKTGEFPDGIPIQAINLDTGLSPKLGSERKVKIIISAPRQTWKTLTADSFSATVDVAKQPEGTYDLSVAVTSKVSGVEIRRVKPSRVSVAVEPVIKKTVPVVVRFTGQAGNDLVPDTPVINPDKVELTGAKSVITDLTQAIVGIKLDGETNTIDQKLTVSVVDSGGEIIQGVTANPEQVGVRVALVKAGKIKMVGIQAAVTGTPKSGYWVKGVTLTPPVVAVTGPVDQLEALGAVSTQPVSVNGLDSDTTMQVDLSLPSGITVADSTKKITVKVMLDKIASLKSISPQIVYANVSGSLQVTAINPTSIATIVAGSSADLATLTDGTVKLTLDLGAYQSAGTYSVTIRNTDFTLPTNISLTSFLPSVISVTLSNK